MKTTIKHVNDIPDNETGQLLLMAISIITTESRTDETPDEVLKSIGERREEVYKEMEVSMEK